LKIVLNRSVGAFRLSDAAIEVIRAAKGNLVRMDEYKLARHRDKLWELVTRPVKLNGIWLTRTDVNLIEALERLGKDAAADGVELEVIEVPDDVEWGIGDVCGIEYVRAAGQLWPKGAIGDEQLTLCLGAVPSNSRGCPSSGKRIEKNRKMPTWMSHDLFAPDR
jgi:hypothetical protein